MGRGSEVGGELGVSEDEGIEGTLRLGRGRMGRVLMRDAGRREVVEGEEYCWGGRIGGECSWAVVVAISLEQRVCY